MYPRSRLEALTYSPMARRGLSGLVALGAIMSTLLVFNASQAAFTASTSNGANNWATGTVALSDDDAESALFNVTNLGPGATSEKCIVVTYGGTLAAGVRLYATGISATNALDQYLTIQIDEGSGGTFSDCTGFSSAATLFNNTLNNLAAVDYSSGLSSWGPTGAAQARTFRFTYTLSSSAPNSTQGSSAAATFTWEAQNT